jgi:hypothetical protein
MEHIPASSVTLPMQNFAGIVMREDDEMKACALGVVERARISD